MNEINKKISAVFLATLMIASIFVAMVTPVAAAHEVTIDNVAPFYVQPGGIVNVEFTITPSHAMEDVDISIHRDNVTIGSFSNTFTDLTPNVPITRTANIEISDVAEEGTFHVAIESSGVNNPPCNDDPVVSASDALKHAIHVDGTAPHKVWGACPADDAIVEFPRTDQTITVTVEDNIQTNGEITLNYFREGFDEVSQQIVMAGMPGISTEYFATIDDTVVVDGNTVSYWITGTDAAGNLIPATLGGTQADPLATYTVIRRTLSFVYVTPGSVDDPVDVVMKNNVDFNFTAHDQFSNPYDEVEIDDVIWTVENPAVGAINPETGIFNATQKGTTEVHVDVTIDGVTVRGTGMVNVVGIKIINPTEANPIPAPSEIFDPRIVNVEIELYTDNIGTTVGTTDEEVTITLRDNTGDVVRIFKPILLDVNVGTTNNHIIPVNIPDIPDGMLDLRVEARDIDASADRFDDEARAIIVDNTPPEIAITEINTIDIAQIDDIFPIRNDEFRVQGVVEEGATVEIAGDITFRRVHLDGTSWFAIVEIPQFLIEGRNYRFTANAIDDSGNMATDGFNFSFDQTMPETVDDLTAVPLNDTVSGAILLNWTATEPDLTFNVYRFITRPANRADLIATEVDYTGFTTPCGDFIFSFIDDCDSLLDCGLRYSYLVRAVDGAGNIGPRSNVVISERGVGVDSIVVTTNTPTLIADGHHENAIITATVIDKRGKPVVGAIVTFDTTAGWVFPTQVATNADGVAITTLTADAVVTTAVINGTVTILENTIYDTTTVAFTPDSYTIELGTGWNLISLPLIPVDNNILSVLGGIIDTVEIVWAYNATTNNWTYFNPDIGGQLELMDDGKGYWIRVNAPGELTVVGFGLLSGSAGLPSEMPPTFPQLPPSYEVVAGWNLIGFTSTEEMIAGGSVYPHGFGEGYLRSVSWKSMWAFCTGGWDRTHWGDHMEPGRGYWLFVTEDGIIAP